MDDDDFNFDFEDTLQQQLEAQAAEEAEQERAAAALQVCFLLIIPKTMCAPHSCVRRMLPSPVSRLYHLLVISVLEPNYISGSVPPT